MTTTFTSFEERYTRTIQDAGNGNPTMSGYHSESVELQRSVISEMGIVTFALNPDVDIQAQIRDKNGIEVKFTSIDQDPEKKECDCDISAVAHIPVPDSITDDGLPEFAAQQVQYHSLFPGMIQVTAQAAGQINYVARNPGFKIEFSSPDLTVTQTRTVEASYGIVNHVGDGSALFYLPQDYNLSGNGANTLRRMPGVIYGQTATTPSPHFFGVLRKRLKPIDPWLKCDCSPEYSQCHEAITEAPGVMVPLEVVPPTKPANPIVFARYMPDPAVNDGKVGGYQVAEFGTTPPTGMVEIPAKVLYYYSASMAIRLARL